MAREPAPGLLVSLDGTRYQDLDEGVDRLMAYFEKSRRYETEHGVSRWDASGTFYEILLGKAKDLRAVPRSLVLLYASDLAFRLRWEIRPALAAGRVIVVAPYVQTVVAMGTALGLPRKWLLEVFSFAPPASIALRVKERKPEKAGKKKPNKGFVEFCTATLTTTMAPFDAAAIRAATIADLDAGDGRTSARLSGKVLKRIEKGGHPPFDTRG